MADVERAVAGRTGSRREEILATAAELFWSKGYSATAMSEIAAALDIQKASLYHHIRAKDTLLYELSIESMHRMIDAASSASELAPLPRLRAIIERHLQALISDQSKHATALTELRSLAPEQRAHVVELRDRYDRIIDEAIRSVQVNNGLWPEIPTKLLRLSLLGMLNWTVFWYRDAGTADITQTVTSIFLGQLVGDPASATGAAEAVGGRRAPQLSPSE
jgi:TetR/AcrR family transcriptional regulator, cholesterol catabolism regulator